MSEPTTPIKQLEGIPVEALIKVDFSGGFYQRLHQFLQYYSQKEGLENIQKATLELKSGDAKSPAAYHLETILTVIFEIEKEAKKQGQIKTVDIPNSL